MGCGRFHLDTAVRVPEKDRHGEGATGRDPILRRRKTSVATAGRVPYLEEDTDSDADGIPWVGREPTKAGDLREEHDKSN